MKYTNLTPSSKKIFAISSLVLSIAVIGLFSPMVYAEHGANFRTELIQPGSEILTFRDSTNILLQSSTLSLDSTTIKAGFITIILQEEDANLQSAPAFAGEFPTGVEIRLSSASSTSSGQETVQVELTETDANSGLFTGRLNLGPGTTNDEQLQLGLGDGITVLYEPELQGSGRFTAEYGGVNGTTGVIIRENLKEDINGDTFYECTSLANTAPFDLITYPIEIIGGKNPGTSITVTMSYANAWEGWDTFYTKEQLIIVYRNSPCAAFDSLGGIVDDVALTVTNEIQPGDLDPPGLQQGQYAVAVDCDCTPGGGGGGLVRQGFVVNVLAGSGSLIGLFTGGSGGGAHPTFGDASLLVLEDISEGFGGVISEGDDISLDSTKIVQTGDTAVLRFELYENQGITNLERFKMFLNFEGENYDASTIDTHITYKRGGEITIVDPHEKFEKVEIEILQVDPWNLIVNVKIIFKNTFNTSILVDSWDLDRNSGKKLFPDALQIVEPSILLADTQKVLNEPTPNLTSEVLTKTELTEIPVWIKSNALWWQQKQIDDSDFMAGIKYLIEKTMIEVDQNDLSNSLTTKEIPVWISDVAGMWADDSITDEEFINIMQWLISKGILQVQQ